MTPNLIPVERLTIGSTITVKDAAWGRMAYLVIGVEFDGSGYLVTYGSELAMLDDERGFRDTLYVNAGDTVDADGDLRAEADVTADEWQAKADAIAAGNLRLQGKLNALHGYQCREIDERPLVASVASALGLAALQAAE